MTVEQETGRAGDDLVEARVDFVSGMTRACAVCGDTGKRCTFSHACSCWRGVPCRASIDDDPRCAECGIDLSPFEIGEHGGNICRRCSTD